MGNAVDKGTGFLFHLNRHVAGSETDKHKHDYAELLYVSDGSITQHVCGEDIDMRMGDVCLINSGCMHYESFEEDTFVIRLEVSDEIINAVISNAMADKQAVDYINELVKVLKNSGYIHFGYKDDYDNELKDMLTAMISECGVSDMASVYICQGLMLRILWRLGTVYEYAQSRYVRKKINWLLHQEITDFIEDNMKDITVDVGAVSKEEAMEKFGIRIGEPVVPDVTFTYSETTDLMVGKSFDCRLGCAAILKTMHNLAGQDLNVDIVGACAAQEEVGVRGATVTAQVIKPDIAIVFEGCPADDTCVEPYMVQTAIKRGPMLRHIDARMITNPRYQRYALDLAEKLGIPVQDAVRSAGATNGAAIHLTEKAVPVIVIGVPVRYAHTHYGISAYADFDNAVKLACEILKRLDEEQIRSF